jgi:hypothetical protein
MMAAGFIALIGVSATVVDVGNVYSAHQELVAASEAAALAGAYDVPAQTTAQTTSDAQAMSAVTGGSNTHRDLTSVTIATSFRCLTSVGVACQAPPGSGTPINAVVVKQQADVPTFFAAIFGIKYFHISATATAVPGSGPVGPANIAIVLDTTGSMNLADTNCTVPGNLNPSRLQCALSATQTLLTMLNPCMVGRSSCGAAINGKVANPVDQVALFVFPGLKAVSAAPLSDPPVQAPTASNDFTCPTSNPSITSYNSNPGYMILPYQSDFRTSDSNGLNTGSHLVTAVGGGSCSGMAAPGGEGTFYAGAIAAAQSYIAANAITGVKNYIVLLSDGDAESNSTQMAGAATHYSTTNECHQAITAAQNAQAAGTHIYTIAYGAEAAGCTTDSPAITPCQTMQGIASTPTSTYFFGDVNQSGGGGDSTCVNNARPISNLNQAFAAIAADLSAARLVPNNAT